MSGCSRRRRVSALPHCRLTRCQPSRSGHRVDLKWWLLIDRDTERALHLLLLIKDARALIGGA
jgi:hypothetical protein